MIEKPNRARRLLASGLLALALASIIGVVPSMGVPQVDAAPATALRPGPMEQVVAKLVGGMLARYHYARQPLDDEVSSQLFDEYFRQLDHGRAYFLASDIEAFAGHRSTLDNELAQGSVDFAFEVYQRFVQRVRDRMEFVRTRLEKPFDFTLNEHVVLDRSEAPWAENVAELDDIWRQRLKNNVLVYDLMGVAATEPDAAPAPEPEPAPVAAGDPENAGVVLAEDAVVAEDAAPAAVPIRSPVERTLLFHERHLRQIEENEPMDVLELYLSSLARVYDPHSSYMAPSTEEDFDIAMRLSLQGIGALLSTEDAIVKVAGIIPGGPAELDGRLKEGDRIVAVAQEGEEPVDVIDMPLRKVVRMIRGAKGTTVHLSVIESGKSLGSVPTRIDIVRDEVKLTEQEAKNEMRGIHLPQTDAADEGGDKTMIAVLSLPSFYTDFEARSKGAEDYKSSTRDVRRLIEEALREGASGMIVDLRANGGGSLDEAVALAGLFIPGGPVVQVRNTDGEVQKRHAPDVPAVYDGPLVVLVDRLSASASEIVAAALQDYRRAVIVGEGGTHGKGTVQTVYHLNNRLRHSPVLRDREAGSLKFTMAKFYRITGGSTQNKGVVPDIVLPSFTDHMELGESRLPHALPWNEIEPLEFAVTVDVGRFLPELRERSNKRLAANPDFQNLLVDVAHFAERRNDKTLSLNRAERIELRDEDAEWSSRFRPPQGRRRRAAPSAGDEDKAPAADLLLDESIHVLADLIVLQRGKMLMPVNAAPVVALDEPPPPTAAGVAVGKAE